MMKGKRAQMTLFVIVAIIIITSLAVGLFYFKQKQEQERFSTEDIKGYIEKCISDEIEAIEPKLLDNNGYMNLSDNYIVYYGEKVPYLCKASQFYVSCINQEPMYLVHLQKEITNEITPKAQVCFSDLKYLLEKKGYSIDEGYMNLSISIQKKLIVVNIDKKFNTQKETESKSYNNFNSQIPSPLYDLAITTERIINYESTLCEFNMMNWMKTYRDISIKKFVTSDQTKIYTVAERESEKSISFAVKTCVLPAGI